MSHRAQQTLHGALANSLPSLELVVLCDFNKWPFSALTGDQAADMIRVAAQKPLDRSAASKSCLFSVLVLFMLTRRCSHPVAPEARLR